MICALSDVTTPAIQTYVTHLMKDGYAPKSIDHIHDVLSAILRSAVKWGHLKANPACGIEIPRLKTIRPKWALTVDQATALVAQLPWLLPRTLVGIALLTGLRRGELFALRWWDLDEPNRSLQVRTAVYEGVFDDPKTMAGLRTIPLPDAALVLLEAWRARARRTARTRADLLDRVRQADLTEQRLASLGVAGLSGGGSATGDVAHVQADVFLVGAREGRAGQGGRADHGAQQGRHHDERLHAGA